MTTLPDDKIMDRLVKLLEMSKRGTEHEAEIAAQRAAELMAKYQLDAADVEAKLGKKDEKPTLEQGRVDSDDPSAPPKRMEKWHSVLLAGVAEVMGGRAWLYGKGRYQQFLMIGPKDSVAAAKYLFAMLERDVNKLSREAGRVHGEPSNAWRRSYALGMVSRIVERLRIGKADAMRGATSGALVVVDKFKQALDTAFADMKLRTPKNAARKRPDATAFGYRDGNKVDLGSTDRARLGEGQKKLSGK